jgi:SNF2 family DNA or RNA helicase
MSVVLSLVRDRIWLVSSYPTAGIGKTVPGARFSDTGGPHWSIPLNVEACLALRERFGDELKVDRSLSAWYREAYAERERLHALATATDAELRRLPRVAPDLAAAMERRTYQRSGARFAADGKRVLIADDPGLGKTLIGMGAVVESGEPGPYLVVCPKTAVESVWAREIPRWLSAMDPKVVTVPDGRVNRDAILDAMVHLSNRAEISREPVVRHALDDTWVVVHPEMIRTQSWWVCRECGSETRKTSKPKELVCDHDPRQAPVRDDHTFPQLFAVEWGAIIMDESDRAIIRLTGTPNQTRNGAELLTIRSGGLKLAMSGTPFRGKPHLIWSTLNWLDSKKYGGKWRWVEQFWKLGGYTGYEIGDLISPDHEQRLWDSLKGIMLRRTKAEVAPDLPPKAYMGTPLAPSDAASPVGVWLPMDPKQAKAYKSMEDDSVVTLEGGELNAIGVLAEMTRLQQFATSAGRMAGTEFMPALPSNKFDWLVEALQEWGFPDDPTTKVVIASRFTRVLDLFAAELLKVKDGRKATPIKSMMLTGAVQGSKRADLIDRFNDPGEAPHILFLQHKTGGVAITIDSADKMVLLDEADVDTMTQVEDRIHRVSKPRPVEYYYLRSEGTIEVGISLVNADRGKNSRRLMDERRGVEYVRRVLELSR